VLEPGARLDQYELIRELGRGGMGVVYAARDTRLGRRVAIKFVLDASGDIAERFLIEARATAQCNHDNIVIIHAVDEHAGVPYMVLEFLEGNTLREVMAATKRLPAARVVELVLPIARALSRAHELDIVHRDLKPENVMITLSGQVKVLDFGIAKAMRDEDSRARRTAKHTWVGTLTYMAPEQMNSDGELDHRADIWALGIMMFELLAGRHPIDPPATEDLITNAVSDDPMPSLASVAPDVPVALARIVDACLVKPRAQRMTSAELVAALEAQLPSRTVRMLAVDECPYPGLAAFQESDADRFFGRSAEVARMIARIRELPLTGVVGPSGTGKSSFVRAGLVPALKATGERWEVVTLRPGRQPIKTLANTLVRVTTPIDAATTLGGARGQTVERIRSEPGYLGSQLRSYARRHAVQLLVYVDQLEELFTLGADPRERLAFLAALAGVADDASAPLRVVVSIRSDFLDRLAEDQHFITELSRGLVLLATPDRAGLREAIEQPLAFANYRFESSAIVGDMLDALASAPGALPLLQFAAAKLWDDRDRTQKLITTASYHAIGGISGALAAHADDVVAGMGAAAQKLTQRVFRALVTPERTRAIVELGELQALAIDRAELSRVIDQLVAARLLVVQTRGDGSGGTVEIVHESLIDRWPALRRWLDEDQEDAAFLAQLGAVAKQWELKHRPPGLLWRGSAADEARRWAEARPRDLTPRDRAYLDAVLALRTRGERKRRTLVIGAFALLAAIAAGAIVAMMSIRSARDSAMRSAREAEDVSARLLAEKQERDAQEREKQAAVTRSEAAEREKLAAETKRQAAELDKAHAEAAVTASREQLEQTNTELRAALQRAEQATAEAKRAALEAEKAKAALQVLLDRERARSKAFEDEAKTLSSKLKE
jgi:hypothetical protein